MPVIAAISVRRMCGFCVDDQIVIVPLPGSKCATTPRGSMAFGTSRWLTMRCLMIDFGLRERPIDRGVIDCRAVGLTPVPLGTSATARLFAKAFVNDGGLAGHRQLRIDHRREWIVGDDDRVRSIAGHVPIGGDDDSDWLAGESDDVGRDGPMVRRRERRPDRHRREELRDLRASEDSLDAVHRLRSTDVDRRDAAMRDIAALECEVLHAGDLEVVDVGAASLDQTRVFATLDALADQFREDGSRWARPTSCPRRSAPR